MRVISLSWSGSLRGFSGSEQWITWLYPNGLGGSATMEYSNLDLIIIQQRESAQILSVSQNTVRDVFDAQDVAVFIGMLCVI